MTRLLAAVELGRGSRQTSTGGSGERLLWEKARFGGANINLEKDGPPVSDEEDFERRLLATLQELQAAGRRGVWMHVPIEHSAAAAVAARHGFAFHSAEGDKATLLRWLPEAKNDEFIYELDKSPKGHLPLTSTLRGQQLLEGLLTHEAWQLEEFADVSF